MNGRIFQVTKDGQIVWEYVNPHFAPLLLRNGKQAQSNYVYRAQPVPYDWVPSGVPHAEKPVKAPPLSQYHVVSQ